jgi:hypothetical protein
MCTTEVLKLVTKAGPTANNNLLFSGELRVYMKHFLFEKRVVEVMERIRREYEFPVTALRGNEVIYMRIQRETEENLERPIEELVEEGEMLIATGRGREDAFEFVLGEGRK